jgi:hypothetical protein
LESTTKIKPWRKKNCNACSTCIETSKTNLCILEIMPPEWANFVLATNIPDSERYVFVLYCFNIETCEESRVKIKYKNSMKKIKLRKPLSQVGLGGGKVTDLPIVGMVVTISPSLSL